MHIRSFHHVGLSVADLDRQCQFYTHAFGLHEEYRTEIPEAGIRISLLTGPGGVALELTERDGSTPQHFPDPVDGAGTQGYFHWALTVDDLDTALATAAARGGRTVSPPASARRPGIRFAYLVDPEDNLLELLQPSVELSWTWLRTTHHPRHESLGRTAASDHATRHMQPDLHRLPPAPAPPEAARRTPFFPKNARLRCLTPQPTGSHRAALPTRPLGEATSLASVPQAPIPRARPRSGTRSKLKTRLITSPGTGQFDLHSWLPLGVSGSDAAFAVMFVIEPERISGI